MSDRFAAARAVADAVLYEGYLLYPYTASALKNQLRWQFGVVVPKGYEAAGSGEHADQRTELIVEAAPGAAVAGIVRFLHVRTRGVEVADAGGFEPAAELAIDGTTYLSFDETVEREIPFALDVDACGTRVAVAVGAEANETIDELRDAGGEIRGRIVRRQAALEGSLSVTCVALPERAGLFRLAIALENLAEGSASVSRNVALRASFIATHTLLAIEGGTFLSPVDPPEFARASVECSRNDRTWPVLMGDPGEDGRRSKLALSSPIILGDFPAVAAKTDTDHFDATEIDELLTLSVLSLSDAERAEACATDARARRIVERAQSYGAADVLAVHDGELITEFPPAWRDLAAPSSGDVAVAARSASFPDPRNRRLIEPGAPVSDDLARLRAGDEAPYEQLPPASLVIGGITVAKGSRVRLSPKRRADSWDMFLRGKLATVRTIHQDFEDKLYVTVTVDDDPATELHDWYGRSLFFEPDEIEATA